MRKKWLLDHKWQFNAVQPPILFLFYKVNKVKSFSSKLLPIGTSQIINYIIKYNIG